MGVVVNATARLLYRRERFDTHYVGSLVGPWARLGSWENLASIGILSPKISKKTNFR